jgi:hypothetical protein
MHIGLHQVQVHSLRDGELEQSGSKRSIRVRTYATEHTVSVQTHARMDDGMVVHVYACGMCDLTV